MTARHLLAERMQHAHPAEIGSILRLGDTTDTVSLAGGLPASETLPLQEASHAFIRSLADGSSSLQYGATNGLPDLRELLADRLRERAVDCRPENVIVTHGSQQGIDLVSKVFVDPGDTVVVDRPSYVGALETFRMFQADIREIPLAQDLGLERFHEGLRSGLRPKLVYVVPNHANPTGRSLSDRQARALVDLSERYGFLIVEDDPYVDVRFGDAKGASPALAGLGSNVVHLGSLSKLLFPGSRVGYLVGPSGFGTALSVARQNADLGNSALLQRAVSQLLRDSAPLDAHTASLRELYRSRRDVLAQTLRKTFDERVEFDLPHGGFFLWVRFSEDVDTGALLHDALREGVSFVPGGAFYAETPDLRTARLAFSGEPAERLELGVRRLGLAHERYVEAGKSEVKP